eukprot:scaffold13375_cov54-Phaeocystis_antarctica.AAC.1
MLPPPGRARLGSVRAPRAAASRSERGTSAARRCGEVRSAFCGGGEVSGEISPEGGIALLLLPRVQSGGSAASGACVRVRRCSCGSLAEAARPVARRGEPDSSGGPRRTTARGAEEWKATCRFSEPLSRAFSARHGDISNAGEIRPSPETSPSGESGPSGLNPFTSAARTAHLSGRSKSGEGDAAAPKPGRHTLNTSIGGDGIRRITRVPAGLVVPIDSCAPSPSSPSSPCCSLSRT